MCDGEIGDRWCKDRKLQQFCYDEVECGWKDKERVPEKRKVTNTKTCIVGDFSGWDYTIYDKYGHTMVLSRTYHSAKEAMKELESDLLRGEKMLRVDLTPASCSTLLLK
jgi:CRISPR/Cas system-associated protein Cas7 (RAMP superfamily)